MTQSRPLMILQSHNLQFLIDWIAPVSIGSLGLILTDAGAYYITKEIVIGISILLGIVTNIIRLYKLENSKKDED